MSEKIKTWVKGQPSPYQLRDLTHFPDWRSLIVWDAFFNNLTSGLTLCAAIAWAAGPPVFAMLLPLALTAALLLVTIDLGILIMDLADPWRFIHSLRVMRFTSPLSVGVWGLASYATFLGMAVILSWISFAAGAPAGLGGMALDTARNIFTIMAIIGAVVVICYKGIVFSCSSQPGLRGARWLTPFLVSDSLLIGTSCYIIIALPFTGGAWPVISLIACFIGLVIARSIAFWLLWQNVKNRARMVYDKENLVVLLTVFGLGGILAIICALLGLFGLCAACVLALCAGVVERHWLIGLAHPWKSANAPFAG